MLVRKKPFFLQNFKLFESRFQFMVKGIAGLVDGLVSNGNKTFMFLYNYHKQTAIQIRNQKSLQTILFRFTILSFSKI